MDSANAKNKVFSLRFNDDIYNSVVSEMKKNKGSAIPQSILIIGQEGSGKTTLLRRLYESCEEKNRTWIDGRKIFSTEDISDSRDFNNESVIFIDDIDYYFNRCPYDEQYKLRHLLYNEGAPMMIATLSKVVASISEYEAPFFEGLRNLYIKPLSKDDLCKILDEKLVERASRLFNLLPPTIGSLMAVCSIIELSDTQENDLKMLLSIFSGKYNKIYEQLPVYSQKILNALSKDEIGLKIPDIRSEEGLKTSILTAYLKALKRNGIIKVDASIKKNTLYTIKDPLFRMWLNR